jgi:hypothetical protein
MSKHQLFSAQEWQTLQFSVLDVFMLVSGIDGNAASDDAEDEALARLLENPDQSQNPLVQELLTSIAVAWKHVLDAYHAQYRFDGQYFEQAFSRVKALVDWKLTTGDAQDFKVALSTQVGGLFANASGPETPDLGRVSESELLAIASVSKWLGTNTSQPAGR